MFSSNTYRHGFRASVLFVLLVLAVGSVSAQQQSQTALSIVHESLDALGGAERLESLQSLAFTSMEHQYALEQSERPEGPWLTTYVDAEEIRDLQGDRARRNTRTRSLLAGSGWNELSLIREDGMTAFEFGGQMRPYPSSLAMPWIDGLRLGPERLMLTARDASDLVYEGRQPLQDVDHLVLGFSVDDEPVRVFINAHSMLPTAVEIHHPAYFDIWGDISHRTYFSFWFLEENGIRYPRQWDTTLDGVPYRSSTILEVEFDLSVVADTFSVPDAVRAQADQMEAMSDMRSAPLGVPNRPAEEIAPDIIEIPGRWDVAIVRQEDGLVILEAPISSEYSVLVLEEAARRYPGEQVKAVITTSDAWPHLAGVREYVSRGITVYASALNQPILERLLEADYSSRPDALSRDQRRGQFVWVDAPVAIGSGANRLELMPMRGEGSERMLMAWFPEHKLLYASDMVQRLRDGTFFMPQYLSEVLDAVEREGLSPERVFAMHLSPTAMEEIREAVLARMTP
jgi:hypothetical protein